MPLPHWGMDRKPEDGSRGIQEKENGGVEEKAA